MPQRSATFRCPTCKICKLEGYLGDGSWFETRCKKCGDTFHYGPHGLYESGSELRCADCHRLQMRGGIGPGSWFETKCNRCSQFLWLCNSNPAISIGRGHEIVLAVATFSVPVQIERVFDASQHAKVQWNDDFEED